MSGGILSITQSVHEYEYAYIFVYSCLESDYEVKYCVPVNTNYIEALRWFLSVKVIKYLDVPDRIFYCKTLFTGGNAVSVDFFRQIQQYCNIYSIPLSVY